MPSRTKRILVAEDDLAMAKALELTLERAGFEPAMAFNGEEALAHMDKGAFDLILLDLMMPKMDGFAVLQVLKDRKNATPVLVMANTTREGDMTRAKALGAREYFVKSDTPLAEIVARAKKELA